MNCAQFDWFVADVAGARADLGAEARLHLTQCDSCQQRMRAERRLTAGLRDIAQELRNTSAPVAVEQRLLSALAARTPLVNVAPIKTATSWPRIRHAMTRFAIAACVVMSMTAIVVRSGHVPNPQVTAHVNSFHYPTVATPFYPVYAPRSGLAAVRGVVRVSVPRATLAVFGLPYDPRRARDPITADLLIANSGVVTAVRFVQ
jgi:hypothetical protein